MSDRSLPQEAADAIREWAGDELRLQGVSGVHRAGREELGTVSVEWKSTGIGFPQTENDEPVAPAVIPQRYELVIVLPPQAREAAAGLAERLRARMAADETLGGRVSAAEIPPGDYAPEDGENEDFEGSLRVRIPVTLYLEP